MTSTSYRFKARPWDLKKVSSTCNCCSVGCSIELNTSQNKMLRILGEDNEFTNQGWLSDKGRYNFDYLHSENRLLNILSKSEDSFNEISISEATKKIKNKIDELDNPNVKFLVGSSSTNEEYFIINEIANYLNKDKFLSKDSSNIYFGDDLLFKGYFEDEYSQAKLEDLDSSETIVIWAEDIKDNLPILYLRVKKAVKNGSKLIVFGHTNTAIAGLADFYFGKDIVSNKFELIQNPNEIEDLKNNIEGKKVTIIAGKSTVFQKKESLDKLINYLNENSELKVLNSFSKGNTFGALQNLDEVKGLNEFCNEFDNNAKNIVFTIGVNPVNSSYFGKKIKENLIASDFVIALDLFVNETTELADMILPTTSLGEKEGTVTNMEMRVMKQNKILPAPGSTLSEWEYLTSLLNVLGVDVNYKNENEINNSLSKQYKDQEQIPTFDNLNKPSNLFGMINKKDININIEDLEEDDFSLLMVRRLYGDSSTQLNTPSISMLGSHRFIELNSSTAKKYGINSEVGNFIQGSNSILINIDINEYLPDDLVVAAINRRGFENIDPCLGFDISEAKNREELNVN
mgnify:FL=1